MFKSHTQTTFYPTNQLHPPGPPAFSESRQRGWWREVFPPKTSAPHQQRQCHCVVSSRWPPAPPESEISAWQFIPERGGQGREEEGVGYSSHSRGKWDEKDLNHAHTQTHTHTHTHTTHLSKTTEGSQQCQGPQAPPTDTQADADSTLHALILRSWGSEYASSLDGICNGLLSCSLQSPSLVSLRMFTSKGKPRTPPPTSKGSKGVHALRKVITKSLHSCFFYGFDRWDWVCVREMSAIVVTGIGLSQEVKWIYEYIHQDPLDCIKAAAP